jgi:hypothetical protein
MYLRVTVMLLALTLVSACTPAEQKYCERYGTSAGSAEYAKCVNYFFNQTAVFNTDRDACEFDADRTYPRSLYDNGRTAWVHGGYGPYGYQGGQSISIEPNYAQNDLVDNLRMQIIAPCMMSKGWRDPNSWEAGRGAPPKMVSKPIQNDKLPWLR